MLHDVRVAHSSRTAHVPEEGLHRLDGALHIDEDRAIGPVRDGADHTVTIGRFRHSRPVIYSLDASVRKTGLVYERVHEPSKPEWSNSLPLLSRGGSRPF